MQNLDIGIFLRYSSSSKTVKVFNKKIMVVRDSIHVIFIFIFMNLTTLFKEEIMLMMS